MAGLRWKIDRDGLGMARVRGLSATLCCAALLAAAPSSEAGHEVPYYPSFYPQEIRIEPLDPAVAGQEFLNKTAPLNLYIGASPRFDAGRPELSQVRPIACRLHRRVAACTKPRRSLSGACQSGCGRAE